MDGFITAQEIARTNQAYPLTVKLASCNTPDCLHAAQIADGSGLRRENVEFTADAAVEQGAVALGEIGAGHTLGGGGASYLYIPAAVEKRTGVQLTTRQATTLKYAVLGRHIDSEMDNRDNVAEILVDIVLMLIALSHKEDPVSGRCHSWLRAVWGCGCLGFDRQDCDRHGGFLGDRCGDSTALHQAGAHPVLAARRVDRLQSLGKELDGGLAVATDVTDREAIRRLVEATLDRYGRIDGLVNNAGASLYTRLDELDLEEFTQVLALNVVSVVAMTQAVLPAMRAQRSGRIVNISSGTTRRVLPSVGGYAATKSALNMLTSVSRKELEADAIAVSLVLPSITATEFGDSRYQPDQQARPEMIAHSPEYVAQVILRALRTGEERIDILHGAEQPQFTTVPSH